jgi:nitroimidazol reductase NimA-like FMN-containing flavoprotein (pyridoxamine 5'-phosphate oxidase superfamily)
MRDMTAAETIRAMLESQTSGVLATASGMQPYANLVAFSFAEDLTCIYFVTPNDTAKYANLVRNANCSLLVDRRSNDPADFSTGAAVTAVGRAVEITGEEKTSRLITHLERLPGLAAFISLPTIALFRIEVESYVVVNGLEGVSVWRP